MSNYVLKYIEIGLEDKSRVVKLGSDNIVARRLSIMSVEEAEEYKAIVDQIEYISQKRALEDNIKNAEFIKLDSERKLKELKEERG